jgi:hypothetical protein
MNTSIPLIKYNLDRKNNIVKLERALEIKQALEGIVDYDC